MTLSLSGGQFRARACPPQAGVKAGIQCAKPSLGLVLRVVQGQQAVDLGPQVSKLGRGTCMRKQLAQGLGALGWQVGQAGGQCTAGCLRVMRCAGWRARAADGAGKLLPQPTRCPRRRLRRRDLGHGRQRRQIWRELRPSHGTSLGACVRDDQ